MICQTCSAENTEEAVFCHKCGTKIVLEQSKKICTQCGNKLNDDDNFCVQCGTSVESFAGDSDDDGVSIPKEEDLLKSYDATIQTYAPLVTSLLIVLIIAYSSWVFLCANSWMDVPVEALVKFGGNIRLLTFSGEEWRLWSSTFIHGGLLHLAMNIVCLWSFGRLLERMSGHMKFLALYFISAIGSSIISMKFNGDVVSAGASGAIFGIFGSFMMYVLVMGKHFGLTYDSIWNHVKEGLIFLVVNFVYSFLPGIDMAAHLGGLLVGTGAGLIFAVVDSVSTKGFLRIFNYWLAVLSAIVITQITYSWYKSNSWNSWIGSDLENREIVFKLNSFAAEKGVAEAQFNLGVMYASGEGVEKDDYKAVKWFREAAEQGNADAQFNLGNMYLNGRGVLKDDSEAVKWYRKAAEQGYASAQCNLGWMYNEGRGVTQDDYEAVMWLRKAAEQGDARAQGSLGWMYENGRGVLKDDSEAVKWYRKAAEQGNADAKEALKRLGY